MAAENVVLTQVTTSAMIVVALEKLKAASWFPWITKEKTKLARLISILAAAGSAVGIHAVWGWTSATHTFNFSVSGLNLTVVALGFWAWAKSFTVNELIYLMVKKNGAAAGPTA